MTTDTTMLFTKINFAKHIIPFDSYILQKPNQKEYRVFMCTVVNESTQKAKLVTEVGIEKWDFTVSIIDDDSLIYLVDKYNKPVLFLTQAQHQHEYNKW